MNKLSLGLDIGTNSVGWAVVDENNNIVKKKDFNMWGVRMFEESSDASARRTYRESRRRLARRKERINLLQNIFKDELEKVDKNFFQRLNDSYYKIEDKILNNRYTFFDDTLTDKSYFKKYPTIFHLRKALMENDEKFDIRMLYLAIHHIIKYRGNFLQEGELFNINDSTQINNYINEINDQLNEIKVNFEDNEDYFDVIQNSSESFEEELKSILVSNNSIRDKKTSLQLLFDCSANSFVNELVIPFLCGSVINVSNLKIIKDMKYDKVQIDLNSEDLENKIEEAKKTIIELAPLFDLIPIIKNIKDYFYLVKLLGNKSSISEAMVNIFDNHHKDLDELKKFIKKFIPNKYDECFRIRDEKINNYCAYVGSTFCDSGKTRFKHCSKEAFYEYIKKLIQNVEDNDIKKDILFKIENNEFLTRQSSNQNSTIPMQLHLMELRKILENQSKYYDFLNEVSDGYSNKDKIILIFKFKIPYYVGPLNNKSDKSWVVRTNEKITPWNFDKVVDKDESAKVFIQRMQNKCTYLHGVDDYCLPKKSLLYSEFNCLQYLNKLSIDGKPIDVELKNNIFNDIFLKNKRPTRKSIEGYLKSNGIDDKRFTSKVEDVTCDMSSYITFKEIFGESFESKKDIVEEIIKDITIFEDKKILEKRLKEIYNLSDDQIKKIKGLNYKGYGNLCKKLLAELVYDDEKTGEFCCGPIIQIMRDTTKNLQEILYDQAYPFISVIDKYNKKLIGSNKKLSVEEYIDDNLYVSPIFKRPLIQTYKIIEEVEQILKQKIDSFYVECARTNKDEKVKKLSRYQQVKELLNDCKKNSKELSAYNIDYNHINSLLENNKDNLRSDKIYLYLTQLGKDIYTLKDIDFGDVLNGNYDIDHIYPQSIIKDDSLSNRVLASKDFNQRVKKDNFLCEISNNLPTNRFGFYDLLLKSKLITKEKYRRLTEKEVSKDKLDGFVNRQLVVTNQAVKGVIELLKNYKGVESTKIIYSKAENISDFRKDYDILKSRTANNYHHAHDAYLNVVVGRALDRYYKYVGRNNFSDYLRLKNNNYTINPKVVLSKDRIYGVDKNIVIWDKEKTIKLLKDNIYNNFDIHETTRTYTSNQLFNKITILPAGEGTVSIKQNKINDISKYGGITSPSYSKYIITKCATNKNEIEYHIEAIPLLNINNIKKYIELLYNGKYKFYEIINDNILINSVVEFGDLKYCISSVNSGGKGFAVKNLKDRNFSYKSICIIRKIEKYNNLIKYDNKISIQNNTIYMTGNNDQIITEDDCEYVKNEIIKIYSKSIYDYSIIQKIIAEYKKSDIKKIEEKIHIIYNILQLLKTNERTTGDLVLLGLSNRSGTLTITTKLKENTKIVNYSVTGYYKKVLFKVPNGI